MNEYLVDLNDYWFLGLEKNQVLIHSCNLLAEHSKSLNSSIHILIFQ
ncbi:hypothetical protein [Albibacterium profundi]|uniref:Uncharacterized protein n=1 Tax=Albibacterium profundi TaxID=3134906 RepID=A0ABV5CGR5_9SPHI